MLDDYMQNAANRFVKEIRNTDIYRKYAYQLEKLRRYPEYYEKVNEFRQKNFEIQNTVQSEDMFDKLDAFENEYSELMENPMIEDFLQAELALCRMIQDISVYVTEELDFG